MSLTHGEIDCVSWFGTVVEAVAQVLIVREPLPIVGHQRPLITNLQTMRAGDVGDRALPQIGAGVRHAEVLRSIDQPGNIAVRGASARALLRHANEIPCRIGVALEVADAEEDAAVARLGNQPIRDGEDHVAWVTSSRRPRTLTASGDTRAGSGWPAVAPVGSTQGLRVPEATHLVARRRLPWRRTLAFLERSVGVSLRLTSGAYSHRLGSPAFRL